MPTGTSTHGFAVVVAIQHKFMINIEVVKIEKNMREDIQI